MRGLEILFLALCVASGLADDDVCLEPDAVIPECSKWVNTETKEPVFFEHQFNCSRFWVCNPDLSDCLHECAAMDEDSALYFDFSIKYPEGPTCNWPFEVDCTNKNNTCAVCRPDQQCILCGDCPDCPEECIDGIMCVCKEGSPCYENNTKPCGICTNHKCMEPECCTDEDCNGTICGEDNNCGECQDDSDCVATACSTCGSNSMCINPECCTNDDCESCAECSNDQCTNPDCCVDTDCAENEYCNTDNNTCVEGCNEDSDCTSLMSCSKCSDHQCTTPECCNSSDCIEDSKPVCDTVEEICVGCNVNSDCTSIMSCSQCSDHQCTTPQCCDDSDCNEDDNKPICDTQEEVCVGCNDDNDCNSIMSCAECSNQQCTSPECCTNDDCTQDSNKPFCNQDDQVCVGCAKNEDCEMYDGECTDGHYDEETSTCFYCSIPETDMYGSCEPGCINDDNCPLDHPVCNTGEHRCVKEGSFTTLKNIEINTVSCSGCSGTKIEGGVVLHLEGKPNTAGTPRCDTNALDHTDKVDYEDGGSSNFDSEDKELLDTCHLANLQSEVRKADITWTGEGKLTLEQVTFCWSDETTLCSVCTVDTPLEQGQKTSMVCVN